VKLVDVDAVEDWRLRKSGLQMRVRWCLLLECHACDRRAGRTKFLVTGAEAAPGRADVDRRWELETVIARMDVIRELEPAAAAVASDSSSS